MHGGEREGGGALQTNLHPSAFYPLKFMTQELNYDSALSISVLLKPNKSAKVGIISLTWSRSQSVPEAAYVTYFTFHSYIRLSNMHLKKHVERSNGREIGRKNRQTYLCPLWAMHNNSSQT